MARKMKNPHMGSTLESFLEEEGIHESATLKATKAVIAWQIAQVMKEEGMGTSNNTAFPHPGRQLSFRSS